MGVDHDDLITVTHVGQGLQDCAIQQRVDVLQHSRLVWLKTSGTSCSFGSRISRRLLLVAVEK